MNREQLIAEIKRVKAVLYTTNSRKLKHDYGKYLRRLQNDLRYYDRHVNNAI